MLCNSTRYFKSESESDVALQQVGEKQTETLKPGALKALQTKSHLQHSNEYQQGFQIVFTGIFSRQ